MMVMNNGGCTPLDFSTAIRPLLAFIIIIFVVGVVFDLVASIIRLWTLRSYLGNYSQCRCGGRRLGGLPVNCKECGLPMPALRLRDLKRMERARQRTLEQQDRLPLLEWRWLNHCRRAGGLSLGLRLDFPSTTLHGHHLYTTWRVSIGLLVGTVMIYVNTRRRPM